MRALVVYGSMFGCTQAIASGVAAGLGPQSSVQVVEVGHAPDRVGDDVDLLVVGGPTHAFGLSRESTRQDAVRRSSGASVTSTSRGLREWLEGLKLRSNQPVVAFDTKVNTPRLPGSAGHAAERRLRRLGGRIVLPSATFYVAGTEGPLIDGEVARARAWGSAIAAKLGSGASAPS